MVKAVIFDLDDTLISERQYIKSGFRHISKLLSEKLDESETEIYQSLMNLFQVSTKDVFNRLFDQYEIYYTKEDIMKLVNEYRNHLPQIQFYDDVLPCIKNLKDKGIKIGIITDGYANAQKQKLKAVNAYNYFDLIILTDELGRSYWKPHPKSFELMKEKLKVNVDQMVYVGDNPEKDFITPNKLKMKTINILRNDGIYSGKNKVLEQKYHADYTLKTLLDIHSLI